MKEHITCSPTPTVEPDKFQLHYRRFREEDKLVYAEIYQSINDEIWKKVICSNEEMKQDTAKMKQDTEQMKKEMNKKWGELANKMGTIVEDIVAPNISDIANQYFQVDDFDFFAIRVKCKNKIDSALSREFDEIAASEEYFFVNETNSAPEIEYVDEFINALKTIYDYFPEHKEKKLVPIFSALNIPEDVKKYLTKHKIYAMAMKDDSMDLVNFGDLKLN
ncbi:MAG: hypothetical protein HQK63_14335 [Desulfamplus sp.]|nr:hypothetical protein [Desulfamplus sp.]